MSLGAEPGLCVTPELWQKWSPRVELEELSLPRCGMCLWLGLLPDRQSGNPNPGCVFFLQ